MLNDFFMGWLGRTTLIAADNTWGLLGVMVIGVALSIWLEQKYKWASKVSGAIIALILAMVLANFNIIPISCVLYDDIVWGVIVPMGIPLLLLQCNLKKIWSETGRMLVIFLIGAVGTIVGAFSIATVSSGVVTLGINYRLQNVFIGAFLLVFIAYKSNLHLLVGRKKKKATA